MSVKTEIDPFATIETERNLAVDDIVTIHELYARKADEGRVYRVEKLPVGANGKNYVIQPVAGGQGMKAPREALVKGKAAEQAKAAKVAEQNADAPDLRIGSVVRLNAKSRVRNGHGVYVVFKVQPDGRVQIIRLGGDPEGRFFRNVEPAWTELVDVSALA